MEPGSSLDGSKLLEMLAEFLVLAASLMPFINGSKCGLLSFDS